MPPTGGVRLGRQTALVGMLATKQPLRTTMYRMEQEGRVPVGVDDRLLEGVGGGRHQELCPGGVLDLLQPQVAVSPDGGGVAADGRSPGFGALGDPVADRVGEDVVLRGEPLAHVVPKLCSVVNWATFPVVSPVFSWITVLTPLTVTVPFCQQGSLAAVIPRFPQPARARPGTRLRQHDPDPGVRAANLIPVAVGAVVDVGQLRQGQPRGLRAGHASVPHRPGGRLANGSDADRARCQDHHAVLTIIK